MRRLLVGIVLVVIVVIASFAYNAIQSTPDPDEIIIGNVDLSEVADGTYLGEYDATMVKARVEVRVDDHQISEIKILEHQNGQGSDAEMITADVIAMQSLDVDLVSGASLSSKVILKAIENAFE